MHEHTHTHTHARARARARNEYKFYVRKFQRFFALRCAILD